MLVNNHTFHFQLAYTNCDNIHVDPSSGDLWVGCQPNWSEVLNHFTHDDHDAVKCSSQVLHLRIKKGLIVDVQEVYSNDGSQINCTSAAVYHKETQSIIMGSVTESPLYCEVKYLL